MFVMREFLFLTWSTVEIGNAMMSLKVNWYPMLEDGEVSYFILNVEEFCNSSLRFEVTWPHT